MGVFCLANASGYLREGGIALKIPRTASEQFEDRIRRTLLIATGKLFSTERQGRSGVSAAATFMAAIVLFAQVRAI